MVLSMLVSGLSHIWEFLTAELTYGIGTGCNGDGSSCTTGGPHWDGDSPFSRAELNFVSPL